jgi:flagellar basal body-associated protein FliL
MADETYETREEAAERRTFISNCLVGFAVTLVILALVGVLYVAVNSAWKAKERERQQQAEIAKICVEQGNIWHHGDCLIARKT